MATNSRVRCHGVAGWTVSRVHFTPVAADPSPLTTVSFRAPSAWAPSNTAGGWNFQQLQIVKSHSRL